MPALNKYAKIAIYSGLASSIATFLQRGTQALEDKVDLLSPYVDADHFIWNEWEDFADKIILLHQTVGLKGPIIIVGHSNGVLACAKICKKLAHHGITVHYVGAIDPTAASFPKFSGNVKYVSEFWASSGYPAFKRWISRKRGAACQFTMEFINQKNTKTLLKKRGSHIGISKDAQVLTQICKEIKIVLENYND